MQIIKACYNGDVRRFQAPAGASFEELENLLRNTFALETPFTVRYSDEDGDCLTISNDAEYLEATRQHPVLKVNVTSPPNAVDPILKVNVASPSNPAAPPVAVPKQAAVPAPAPVRTTKQTTAPATAAVRAPAAAPKQAAGSKQAAPETGSKQAAPETRSKQAAPKTRSESKQAAPETAQPSPQGCGRYGGGWGGRGWGRRWGCDGGSANTSDMGPSCGAPPCGLKLFLFLPFFIFAAKAGFCLLKFALLVPFFVLSALPCCMFPLFMLFFVGKMVRCASMGPRHPSLHNCPCPLLMFKRKLCKFMRAGSWNCGGNWNTPEQQASRTVQPSAPEPDTQQQPETASQSEAKPTAAGTKHTKYPEQLQQLRALGFTDDRVSTTLLDMYEGDIRSVCTYLFGNK